MKLIKGNIIHTKVKETFEVFENGYLLISEDKIVEVGENLQTLYPQVEVLDYSGHLIMPSFTDLHSHAVQYGNLGMGFDESLLEWLETCTFPEESKFSDLEYAKNIFDLVLKEVVDQGTTRIAFYSSVHPEATKLLMKMCHEIGIQAFVGKVCMDRNSPDYLLESLEDSIENTKAVLKTNYPDVKGLITPRFVPTCSDELQNKLGELTQEGYGVQTHLSENIAEIAWVKSLHPNSKNYLDVYDGYNLINSKTILGHCVFCTEDEMHVIKKRKSFVAHCPSANFNLTSGLMPIRNYLKAEIKVGLGTDVGAGHSISIKTAIIQSIQMSKCYEMNHPNIKALSLSEAFYLGTKGGGAYFGKAGSFEKGYKADFLIVQPASIEKFKKLTPKEALEKFIYSGHKNDILEVYSKGKKIKG